MNEKQHTIVNSSQSITAWSCDVEGHAEEGVVLEADGNAMHGCSSLFHLTMSTVCKKLHERGTDCAGLTALGHKTKSLLWTVNMLPRCHQVERSLCQEIGKIEKLNEAL